jgi:DNA-binding winged helix-turn-helix (wHTH) protein
MEVFGQKFDHMDKSQEDRLNTAIHRLRERLEPGKKRSRYIVNVPEGYMLKCDQES